MKKESVKMKKDFSKLVLMGLCIILMICLLEVQYVIAENCRIYNSEGAPVSQKINCCETIDTNGRCTTGAVLGTYGTTTCSLSSQCGGCTPKTCAQLGKQCGGPYSNGCGGTVTCSACPSGQTCSNGQCISSCNPQTCTTTNQCKTATCSGSNCQITNKIYGTPCTQLANLSPFLSFLRFLGIKLSSKSTAQSTGTGNVCDGNGNCITGSCDINGCLPKCLEITNKSKSICSILPDCNKFKCQGVNSLKPYAKDTTGNVVAAADTGCNIGFGDVILPETCAEPPPKEGHKCQLDPNNIENLNGICHDKKCISNPCKNNDNPTTNKPDGTDCTNVLNKINEQGKCKGGYCEVDTCKSPTIKPDLTPCKSSSEFTVLSDGICKFGSCFTRELYYCWKMGSANTIKSLCLQLAEGNLDSALVFAQSIVPVPDNPPKSCVEKYSGEPGKIYNRDGNQWVGGKLYNGKCKEGTCKMDSKNPVFTPQPNPSAPKQFSVYIIKNLNNFSAEGVAYFVGPHIVLNKNATVTINYSYYSNIPNPETYKSEDDEEILNLCNSSLITNISKNIGPSGGIISLSNEMTVNIPSTALNNIININITKYNLSSCYASDYESPEPGLVSSSADSNANLNSKFQMRCNFGYPNLGCVYAYHGTNACTYTGYIGNDSIWECTATTAGTITNYCNTFAYIEDPRTICTTQTISIPQKTIVTNPNVLKLVSSSAPISANLGTDIQMKCNFGIPFLGCVQAKHGNNDCTYVRYSGIDSYWSCKTTTKGIIDNYCNIFDLAGDSRCTAQENKIQSTTVLNSNEIKLINSSAQSPISLGNTLTIKCNFGIPFLGCVQAKHGNNDCTYIRYSGEDSYWSCTATTTGIIDNYCNIFDLAGDARCIAKENKIQSTTVI